MKVGPEILDPSYTFHRLIPALPLPEPELEAAFAQHANAREFLWVQEEPANMGALSYIIPQLERLARGNRVRSVKRSPSSTPATGSHTAHEMEQKTLMELAFAAL